MKKVVVVEEMVVVVEIGVREDGQSVWWRTCSKLSDEIEAVLF